MRLFPKKQRTGLIYLPYIGSYSYQYRSSTAIYLHALNLSIERGQSELMELESPLPDLNWGHPDVC